MINVPPVTPADDKFDRASDATLVPTTDFQVAAPRIGYWIEAASIAAAAASLARRLEMHTELVENILGIGQDIDQM